MKSTLSLSSKPQKILVITMRFLGDVLLTTPLVHSLRQAYPEAQLDVLVFGNTAAMLEGNQDISRIITIPNRPKWGDSWRLFRQLFRRYDLAMATQTGDRPFFYTLLAASFRVAVVPPKKTTGWWKRFFMQRWTEFDGDTHTVLQHLKLLDLINVPKCFALVPPQIGDSRELIQRLPFLADETRFAVLHPHPQWAYKQWTVDGWLEIGRYLNDLGLTVVLSGGQAQDEIDYVAHLQRQLPEGTINLAGQVSLAQLAAILAQATLYVGPDTSITHLAAATGIPVIALYGPTNPVKWAPFPLGYEYTANPFAAKGEQQVNNVALVQGDAECVPCDLEGCDRHRHSRSRCLDELSPEIVNRWVRKLVD